MNYYYIKQLKNKLDLNGLDDAESYGIFFQSIAEILLNNVLIAKKEKLFEIIEIEFYLFSQKHPDVITYPRQLDGGQWYFHQSGVDLSFKSNETTFGGILIRGIREHATDKKPIIGPLKCIDTLWDHFDAFNPELDSYPHIVEYVNPVQKKITRLPRFIPISDDQKREYKIKEWIKRLPEVDRINLTISVTDLKKALFDKEYRFIAE